MRTILLILLVACGGPRATREHCERILERIVDIELKERGYNDPMLQTMKRAAFKRKLDSELDRCVGRKLPGKAMECVDRATKIETLTHECLDL